MTDIEYLKKYYPGNIEEALNRLESGEPVQYIVGTVDFYGYTFKVNKNVLIPRFETEELVKNTIDIITEKYKYKNIKILDIGTGSGCIAITLKKELPNSNITAIDISDDALNVAIENAKTNDVDINFKKSDLFENISEKYDVIISNPPYIKTEEEIDSKVKNNEPHIALYAGPDGLDIYKRILENSMLYLNDKFLLAFEIGETQGKDIKSLAEKYLKDVTITIKKDIYNRNRFVFITKNE